MPTRPTSHAARLPRHPEPQRLSARERGYTWRWEKYRRMFLREHPICVDCDREGRPDAATIVDHVIPHKGNYQLFWDPTNHQPLCEHHHNEKTAREDGGFGHPVRGPRVVV